MHGQRPAREHSGRHRGPRQTVRGLVSTFLLDIYLAMHSIMMKPTPTPLTNTPYALCVVAGRRGYRVWRRRRVCLEEEAWTGAAPGPPGWCPRASRMKIPSIFCSYVPRSKLLQATADQHGFSYFLHPWPTTTGILCSRCAFAGALRSTAGR